MLNLYVVKNDKGEFWDFYAVKFGIWRNNVYNTNDYLRAVTAANAHGGRVFPLVEEPKKVVLTKDQAEIVEVAHQVPSPARYISSQASAYFSGYGELYVEKLLMNAFVNGYTVKKEKRFILPLDGTLEEGDDGDDYQYYVSYYEGRWEVEECETDESYSKPIVTEGQLENAPEWVKSVKPIEVKDDEE